jgi:hypothetical protein
MSKVLITPEQLESVRSDLEDFAYDEEVNVRDGYSGRGMYGETCVAVDYVSETVPMAFLALLAEKLDRDFLDLLGELGGGSRDGMGRGSVAYWRGLQVES